MKRKQTNPYPAIARLLRAVSQPARLKILLSIDEGEVTVSELEARLQLRQAYISQQLMALRKAGLVHSRREGRNMFYRLANRRLLNLIRMAGCVAGERESHPTGEFPFPPLPPCDCLLCQDQDEKHPGSRGYSHGLKAVPEVSG